MLWKRPSRVSEAGAPLLIPFEQTSRDVLALFKRLAISLFPHRSGQGPVGMVQVLQTLSHHKRARISNRAFRNQPAAQGDFADEFAGEGAPAEGTGTDRQNFALLVGKSGFPAGG